MTSAAPAERERAIQLADAVVALLARVKFSYRDEKELQEGIRRVLTMAGLSFEREAQLAGRDRIDFWLEPGLGLEVKVDGSLSLVTRQLHRYSEHPTVHALLLVTSCSNHRALPHAMSDKPVRVHLLRSRAF